MATEVFSNLGSTTVAASKTAVAGGTVESWTVASSASFPAVTTGAGTQFRIVEDDATNQSEVILVTNISGTTWTVTRGAEGTTPVAHPAGATYVQTISAGVLAAFAQAVNTVTTDTTQSISGSKTLTAPLTIAVDNPTTGTANTDSALEIGTRVGFMSTTAGSYQLDNGYFNGTSFVARSTATNLQYTLMNSAGLSYYAFSGAVTAGTSYSPGLRFVCSAGGVFDVKGSIQASGLTGAQSNARWVGATSTGAAPTSGTFVLGDFVVSQTGHIWVCTVGGTPGTWVEVAPANMVTTDTTQNISGGKTYTGALTMSGANTGFSLTDGTSTVQLALASAGGAYHSASLNGDAVIRGAAAGNTQGVVLAAGPSSTGYVRVGSAGTTAGGTLTVTGTAQATTMTTTSGATAQFGGPASVGVYVDAANLAIRLPSTTGIIYFQAPSGASGSSMSYTPTNGILTGMTTITMPASALNSGGQSSWSYGGATQDNYGYGIVGVTAPADANNYTYYSMTKAGTTVFGMGIGGSGSNHNNRLVIGIAGGSITGMGNAAQSNVLAIDSSGNVFANTFYAAYSGVGSRFVGGVLSGSPAAGTWSQGDFTVSQTGHIWVCTAGGTPGTWVDAGAWGAGGGGAALGGTNTWTGVQTFTLTTNMQTSDGSLPLSIKARTTANGGQSAGLLEFRDVNGTNWVSFDATGNYTSLLTTTSASLVAGNGLGTVGQLILNKPTTADVGNAIRNSSNLKFRTAYWTTVSNDEDLTMTGVRLSAAVGDAVIQTDHALSLKDISTSLTTTSGQVSIYSASGRGKIKDGVGNVWNLDSSQLVRAAADVPTASIVNPPTVSSGLAVTLQPGTYAYEINGGWRGSVTTSGFRVAMTFGGTQTAVSMAAFLAVSGTASGNGATYTINTALTSANAGAVNTDYPFQITGTIVVTAAGTLTLVFGGTAASTTTIRIGSYMRVTRIA